MSVMTIDCIHANVTNVWVLRGQTVALIDTGMAGSAPGILCGLKALGVSPEAVKLIILTHGHWDHSGSAAALCAATGARLMVHTADTEWGVEPGTSPIPPGVTAWGRLFRYLMGVMHRLAPNVMQSVPAHVDVSVGTNGLDVHALGIPGRIISTPGHTPGSITILLDSGEAFVGDQAMNGLPFCLKPSLPIFAMDLPSVKESWRSLLKQNVTTVYPSHGHPFAAEYMRNLVF